MRWVWLLTAPMVAACGYAGIAAGEGGSGSGDGGIGDGRASGVDGATTVPIGGDSGVCEPSACSGLRCDTGACSYFASCKGLRDQGPVAARTKSAVYTFSNLPSGPFSAYCEMTLAGGGWTLVGQSGSGTSASFGWHGATGLVLPEGPAYSLDAIGHGVPMTEALLARGSRDAIDAAFVVQLPSGFPVGYDNRAASDVVTRVKSGDCASGPLPTMMTNVGYTAVSDNFFFRDKTDGPYPVGLQPGGWDLYYSSSCGQSGNFKDVPGMLFVR